VPAARAPSARRPRDPLLGFCAPSATQPTRSASPGFASPGTFRPRGFTPPRRVAPLPARGPEGPLPLMGFAPRPASPAWRVATPGTLAFSSCNEASSSEEHEVRCPRYPGCRPGRPARSKPVGRTGTNWRTRLPPVSGCPPWPSRRPKPPHLPGRRWERSAGKPARRTRVSGVASRVRRVSEESRTVPQGSAPVMRSGASGARLRVAPACLTEFGGCRGLRPVWPSPSGCPDHSGPSMSPVFQRASRSGRRGRIKSYHLMCKKLKLDRTPHLFQNCSHHALR